MHVDFLNTSSDYWEIGEDQGTTNIPLPVRLERQVAEQIFSIPPPIPARPASNIHPKIHKPKKLSGPIYRMNGNSRKELDPSQASLMLDSYKKMVQIQKLDEYKKTLQKQKVFAGSLPRIRRYGELKRRPTTSISKSKNSVEDGEGSRESETTLNDESRHSTYTPPMVKIKEVNFSKTKEATFTDQPRYSFGAKMSTWVKRLAINPNKVY
jgi:hypothetical protein